MTSEIKKKLLEITNIITQMKNLVRGLYILVLHVQSCPPVCGPLAAPGSSVHGIFQARELGVGLCDPVDCSTPDFPVHHQIPDLTQTQVHWVSDAIQPSHPLSSPSPPAFNLSQWVSSSHQAVKILGFQLQYQSFQWVFRTDFLED